MSNLETRPLGHSGIQVSVIGLGCNQFGGRLDLEGTRAVLDGAREHGITHLDGADRYGNTRSEEFIGEVLKGGRRDEVVLATKFGLQLDDGWEGPRGAPEYVAHAIDESLRRLQTDVIDLYYYHVPDGVTPIADTLEALDAVVKAGKARAIGVSNFSAEQLAQADAIARERGLTRFTALQNEYSLLHRDPEDDVLTLCEQLDVAFIPYFPLASGLLTGKYRRDQPTPQDARLSGREEIATPHQWEVVERLVAYAQARDVPLAEIAIGTLLTKRAVASVIAGVTSVAQLESNVRAARWRPSAEDLAELTALVA